MKNRSSTQARTRRSAHARARGDESWAVTTSKAASRTIARPRPGTCRRSGVRWRYPVKRRRTSTARQRLRQIEVLGHRGRVRWGRRSPYLSTQRSGTLGGGHHGLDLCWIGRHGRRIERVSSDSSVPQSMSSHPAEERRRTGREGRSRGRELAKEVDGAEWMSDEQGPDAVRRVSWRGRRISETSRGATWPAVIKQDLRTATRSHPHSPSTRSSRPTCRRRSR